MIGRGASGVVYRGTQDSPRRDVAVKLLRPELLGTASHRRFMQEAEALGRLNDEGIARVFEARVTCASDSGHGEARPYIVMELVRGEAITHYAARVGLPRRERLGLFIRVCEAVASAHAAGIVHRDLKPAHVLVEACAEGEILGWSAPLRVKVLDFGLARLRAGEGCADVQAAGHRAVAGGRAGGVSAAHTRTGELLGTLEYMAPEQIDGSAGVDHRADVYGLGAVLYELLSGQPPLPMTDGPLYAALRAIQQDEPRMLGTMDATLAGDLETIVSKALQKVPGDRYATVAALRDDLQWHLADRPIVARAAPWWQRTAKFARRNRAVVVGAGAVFVALSIGLVVATGQAVRATRAQRDMLDEVQAQRRQAQYLLYDLHDAFVRTPAFAPTRALIARRALEQLEGVERKVGSSPQLALDLGEANGRLARALYSANEPSTGQMNEALAAYARAIALFDGVFASQADSASAVAIQAASSAASNRRAMGMALLSTPRLPEAVRVLRESDSGYARLARAHPDRIEFVVEWTAGAPTLVRLLRAIGGEAGAAEAGARCDTMAALMDERRRDMDSVESRGPGIARLALGRALAEIGHGIDAEAWLVEAARLLDRNLRAAPALRSADWLDAADPWRVLASVREDRGDWAGSAAALVAAAELYDRAIAAAPRGTDALDVQATTCARLAMSLARIGDATGARESVVRAVRADGMINESDGASPMSQRNRLIWLLEAAEAMLIVAKAEGGAPDDRRARFRDVAALCQWALAIAEARLAGGWSDAPSMRPEAIRTALASAEAQARNGQP